MTAPFALSIHKFVNSVGADVGFASIIAVALLVLLYFAHARETATLRERLDEAHQRISGLETRIAQLMHAQAAAQRGRVPAPVTPPPVVPQPAPARPMGSAIASVRRVPAPATATAAAGAGPSPAPAALLGGGTIPAAPIGMAGPPLASATKLIPDPVRPAPDDTVFVAPAAATAVTAAAAATSAATAAGNGQAGTDQAAAAGPPTQALPAVATAAARTPSASPRRAPAPAATADAGRGAGEQPRAGSRGRGGLQFEASGRPAGAARGASSRSNGAPPTTSLLEDDSRSGRLSGRLWPLLIGGVAVVVIIVGIVVITTKGGSTTTGNIVHTNTTGNTTGAQVSQKHHHHAAVPFTPSSITVAVLNGTSVAGLAGDVGNKLVNAGYKKGNITNAVSQTQASTLVYYMPGTNANANKVAARHVAVALGLSSSRVRPAVQSVIQSCATSPSGSAVSSCGANVIVSVGSDRASLASGGSAG